MAKKMKAKLPVAKAVDYPTPTVASEKESKERERRWRAESGLRTIQEAEEIKRDKQRMADIKALANEQVSNLKKFCK